MVIAIEANKIVGSDEVLEIIALFFISWNEGYLKWIDSEVERQQMEEKLHHLQLYYGMGECSLLIPAG